MAHKLGGKYGIPHGRANAILLPYVIEYNAQKPTKFASFPKYGEFVADKRYANLARRLGLAASTPEEGVQSLINAIRDLLKKTDRPMTIKECGVDEKTFLANLEELSYRAFEDQCTTANPRYPLVPEIMEVFKKAYYGK